MKYAKYGFVLSIVVGALGIVGSFKMPKSFGRTHFIVGYPHTKQERGGTRHDQASTASAHRSSHSRSVSADQLTHEAGVHRVFFSSDDDLQQALITLIANEKESLKMAIFMITTKEIINALIAAHERGVKVTVLTDNMCVRDRWSKIDLLKKAGITVYEYVPEKAQNRLMNDLMHNKFVIFADTLDHTPLVWTGSFNFTRSAQLCNQENAVILNDAAAVAKFTQQFKRLKKRSKRLV